MNTQKRLDKMRQDEPRRYKLSKEEKRPAGKRRDKTKQDEHRGA